MELSFKKNKNFDNRDPNWDYENEYDWDALDYMYRKDNIHNKGEDALSVPASSLTL